MTSLYSTIYSGSISTRLAAGQAIIQNIGPALMVDEIFQDEFERLETYARDVNSHMGKMELGSLCVSCATRPNGGCCSLYMSQEIDGVQLSLNSLAGVDVRVVREDGSNCLFLGESGCIFLFKPMFCLNYLCGQIRRFSSPSAINTLERLTGRLLGKQFELEQRILDCLRSRDSQL